MAVPSITPLFAPQIGVQRDFQESEEEIATVNVPCTGLSSTSLANWLQQEQGNHLELLQAAWSISLRSYTGSDDVLFSCLNLKEYVFQVQGKLLLELCLTAGNEGAATAMFRPHSQYEASSIYAA